MSRNRHSLVLFKVSKVPLRLKPVILKPVGRMLVLGECDLLGTPILRFKTRVAGSWLGIARTEPRNPSDRKMAQDGTCG